MEIKVFAERLKSAREKEGLTQEELAVKAEVSRSSIQLYERGQGQPRDKKTIYRLAIAAGVMPSWLAGEYIEDNHRVVEPYEDDLVFIPTVESLLSSDNSLRIMKDDPVGRPFFKHWAEQRGENKHLVLVRAIDNYMAPTITEGDSALINITKKEPISGRVYAVGLNSRVHLLRVFWEFNKITISGDNKDISRQINITIDSKDDSESMVILGRALWWEHNEWPLD